MNKKGRTKRIRNPVAPQFVAYYQAIKVFGSRGDLTSFAEFCGVSQSYLSSIASGKADMPFDVAVKAAYYSKGKLDICDLVPCIKPYMPILARIQLIYEKKDKSKKEKLAMIEQLYSTDDLASNDGMDPDNLDKFYTMKEMFADEKSNQTA